LKPITKEDAMDSSKRDDSKTGASAESATGLERRKIRLGLSVCKTLDRTWLHRRQWLLRLLAALRSARVPA
jgi:hypothetical protein